MLTASCRCTTTAPACFCRGIGSVWSAPARTAPKHQSLLHFVAQAPWSDQAVLTKVRQIALPGIEAHGVIEAWIIDDTGFPKKGRPSVGVAPPYWGHPG